MMNYDAIVLGTGGVGSAAIYHLAKRGVRVLGLDRFPPAHDRGSSHGESRVIRKSYFEHPDYVPLLNSAYDLWNELGDTTGSSLLHQTGLLYFGAQNGPVIRGVLESSTQHNLNVEQLTLHEAGTRFPQFTAPPDTTALYEPDGGFLLVEQCVRAYIEQAVKLGAQHRHSENVTGWTSSDGDICVQTDRGKYYADRLIIAAGCWTNDLLADLQIPLRIVRKHLHWYNIENSRLQARHGCPCYFFEVDGGYFYGCPGIGNLGLKVAEHSGGTEIKDPLNDSDDTEETDDARIQNFVNNHIPNASSKKTAHKTCFYTMTHDEHFIVDRHPEHASVVFAAGLSGHGFKFTSALGKVLAELTMDEAPTCDINFLSLQSSRHRSS